MGNGESTYDDSHDDFQLHPPSHARSSMDTYHQPDNPHDDFQHHPSSHAGSSADTYHQPYDNPQDDFRHDPPSHVKSSMDTYHRYKQHPTYIADNFSSLDQVISALREAGLESSNLILGIDFTKSNEWTGKYSFNRKSLHAIGSTPNPYEQAISIIGRTLSPFDEDNLIPCFGFGDATTHDKHVFSFYPDQRQCHGFEEALARYREIVPYLKLAGPTSFAPIIDAAIGIVERTNGQYHVLVIIADGLVTRSLDTPPGRFSPQEKATVDSIVAASQYPLSIILVGVGDGPWDAMQQFDDNIPHRSFDNFQFVNFTKVMTENTEASKKETAFALAALMEIPFQYRATQRLVNRGSVAAPHTRPLPPPPEVIDHDNEVKTVPIMTDFKPVEASAPVEPVCPICLTNPKNLAFGCGHTTCKDCGMNLSLCPMCREPITTRLRLFT
ncbi:E3 ubiquitin-protein ligase RGLG3-like isoform X3 [Juglans microcarpa x Juglans regia]|uniref:E3 ubiquitin-protein ligase RGLG3-like isoform X3 n=1 Tax=Juglans microcarpa x Juglans regia TaxID=2249226 RepID=UPI001B7F6DB0|nr:E3 ubiquitin-protein ligase RGLG3-like isoform X3 [Juglans microcarpa x Juglans regia]XP_041008016.1 E3 ubiquitin-protein ligase RGLG3-like isoform X3 [Juglans microcarpa x Juglans regia]